MQTYRRLVFVQISWILQSIIDEARSSPRVDSIRSLLDECKESAMAMPEANFGAKYTGCHDARGRMCDSQCVEIQRVFKPVLTSPVASPCIPESQSSVVRCSRLRCLQDELGTGEGVTALIQASLHNMEAGGDGIIGQASEQDSGAHVDSQFPSKPLHQFQATVTFFDALCNCGRGLVSLPHEQRPSTLRQRLEKCNEMLFIPSMMSQVRFVHVNVLCSAM